VLIVLFSLYLVQNVRGQSGGCKRSSWNGCFVVTWWSTGRRCMREIIGFFHLRGCFGLSLVRKLFTNSIDLIRSGKFVGTLVEFRFRLLVRDRVGADTFL
jgi:hypothetical protein